MSSLVLPAETACNFCGETKTKLMRCSKCQLAYYCSRDHQIEDWRKNHKDFCKKHRREQVLVTNIKADVTTQNRKESTSPTTKPYTTEGSSETEILCAASQSLNNNLPYLLPGTSHSLTNDTTKTMKIFSEVSLNDVYSQRPNEEADAWWTSVERLASLVVQDMNKFGLCVLDGFLGAEQGLKVLEEVKLIKQANLLQDGQLMKKGTEDTTKTIRSDKICWLEGTEPYCENIKKYINKVDAVVQRANRLPDNGDLGLYDIRNRTKAMVACYPGSGAHYVQHIDNPNRDGRCITSIYYLNLDWTEDCGGVLRIKPEKAQQTLSVEPKFDQLLLFWSDRRSPHEVTPAYSDRFAITLWYFDHNEREEATKRYKQAKASRDRRENASISRYPPST